MSKFDALALAVDEPSRMTIQHPITGQPLRDKEGKEAWIDLLSPDSEAAQKYERRVNNARLSKRVRSNVTAEELQAEQAGRLAAMTVGWYLVGLDEEPIDLKHSDADARDLYSNRGMFWLREQVEVWLANRANFTPPSAKSS